MSLNQSALELALQQAWSGEYKLDLFETLGSTNQHLKSGLAVQAEPAKPAAAHPVNRICVTELQTAGVGRQGRVWHSPLNSITFSLQYAFKLPAADLMGLSLVTGLTVADVLAAHTDQQIELKWPNDLLVAGRKLAGILIELPQIRQSGCTSITGIGINFAAGPEHLKVDQPFVTLESLMTTQLPDKSQLIGTLAGSILANYDTFARQGWQAFAAGWHQRDYLSGKKVSLSIGDKVLEGTATGVAANGGLIVKQGDLEQIYYSGEVSVRLRKSS